MITKLYEHEVSVEECLNMMTIRAADLRKLVQDLVKVADESERERVFKACVHLLDAIETLKAIKFGRA